MNNLLLTILTCLSIGLQAQIEWENHTSINSIVEIETYGDSVYITNRGNLAIYDIESGEGRELFPSNSGLKGSGTGEIEILSNGNHWVSNFHGEDLFFYNGTEHIRHELDNKYTDISKLRATDEVLWFTSEDISTGMQEVLSIEDGQLIHHNRLPESITNYTLSEDGVLWLVAANEIYTYSDGVLESASALPVMPSFMTKEYFRTSNGTHWIYGRDSLFQNFILWNEDGKWNERPVNYNLEFFYEDGTHDIAFATDRTVGTFTDGLSNQIPFVEILPTLTTALNDNDLKLVDHNSGFWFYNFTGYQEPLVINVNNGITRSYAQNSYCLLYTSPSPRDS